METTPKKMSLTGRIQVAAARLKDAAKERVSRVTDKGLLPWAWGGAIVAAAALAVSFHGKSEFFYGIVANREQVISFQYPVEIVRIHAVEGKAVSSGQPILEVRRYDLSSGQDTLDEKIRRFGLEKKESAATLGSQVANLVAKREAALADLDSQIHALERKVRALESVSGVEKKSDDGVRIDPAELVDLKQKRHFTDKAIQAEINNLKSQLAAGSRPIDAQIAELEKTKTESLRQSGALKVGALFDGRVSSVNFRPGELVPAYQPILTVLSLAPRDIKGYVHENVLNDVKIGQTVYVKSIGTDRIQLTLEAVVEGMGNRIVEYPVRLRRNQAVTAWGREVVVKLKNEENSLLFGEKVEMSLVRKTDWASLMGSAYASNRANANTVITNTQTTSDGFAQALTSDNEKIQADAVEASGIWWNAKESHYLMVSDEDYDKKPGIFIVNANMRITDQLAMLNPTQIGDLESISSDGDYVYALSSQSHNRQDKLKGKRKQLVRFQYQQNKVTFQQEVDLYDVLVRLSREQPQSKLSTFLAKALNEGSIDIESHFVRDNNLYLGFKSPYGDGDSTVIIELSNVAAIFSGLKTVGKVWKEINLVDPETGRPARLSDMILVKDTLFLLGVSKMAVKSSHLWSYQLQDSKLTMRKKFTGIAAEGLAYRPDTATLMVVFDEGNKKISKYQSLRLFDIERLGSAP